MLHIIEVQEAAAMCGFWSYRVVAFGLGLKLTGKSRRKCMTSMRSSGRGTLVNNVRAHQVKLRSVHFI